MTDELRELVDFPAERPDVEYKAWLDLSEAKHRADIARHIAALANYGGGYVVFGIDDDGKSCGQAPSGHCIDHDTVAGITRKYLEPALHCDVRDVEAATGVTHPVVVVPPHGATPVCAKANGPEINGRVTAIVAGTYYLRKPGPESARIETASEWRDVIRRCALHDRAAILAAVTAALSGAQARGTQGAATDLLKRWAEAADQGFLAKLGDTKLTVPVRECRIQLSYRVETEADEVLPERGLVDTLRQVAAEVDQHVKSGWSIFYVFADEGMRPRWTSSSGPDGDEFLEAKMITTGRELGLDLWRVSPRGLATVIREFWEDTPPFQLTPRTTLNPKILSRTLGELVRGIWRSFRQPYPRRVPLRMARVEGAATLRSERYSIPYGPCRRRSRRHRRSVAHRRSGDRYRRDSFKIGRQGRTCPRLGRLYSAMGPGRNGRLATTLTEARRARRSARFWQSEDIARGAARWP